MLATDTSPLSAQSAHNRTRAQEGHGHRVTSWGKVNHDSK